MTESGKGRKRTKGRFRLLFLLLLAASCMVSGAPATARAADQPWKHVISHRGASAERIEHTFAAYDLAIEYGSHYIEQDVMPSKQGTLYVSHDRTATRLTGVKRKYSSMLNPEINQLQVKNGEHIHTLQSVFNRYGKTVTYVVELKTGWDCVDPFIAIIRKNKMHKNVIVQSWDPFILEELESVFPSMPKMLLIKTNQDLLDQAVSKSGIDIICTGQALMTEDNVWKVQRTGKKYAVYTLNSTKKIKNAIIMNVDMYFTNYTQRALSLEKKYKNWRE